MPLIEVKLYDHRVTEESVPNIQGADLQAFHRNLAAPNNCVLAIYGDVLKIRSQRQCSKGRRGEAVQ